MARTNKYASLNFNHIYDKKINSSPSPNSTTNIPAKSTISSHHGGRMLVLTRPTPNPLTFVSTPSASPSPQTPLNQPSTGDQPRSEPECDRISLRPLGRTGAASPISSSAHGLDKSPKREIGNIVVSPRSDKFVPPHLRPGFVGKEERPGPPLRPPQQQQGYFGSPGSYGEDGRPSTGGHDRMRKGGRPDLGFMNRPGSSGNRPTSR